MVESRIRPCYMVQLRAFGSRVNHVLGVYTVKVKALENMKRLLEKYKEEGLYAVQAESSNEPGCFLWYDIWKKNYEGEDRMMYSIYGSRFVMDRELAQENVA